MSDVEPGRSYRIAFRNDPKDPHFGKNVKVKSVDESGDCLVMLSNGRHLRYHQSLLRTPEQFATDNEDFNRQPAWLTRLGSGIPSI